MKKIKVDFDLCESNAMCEALAPDHFQIDDDDYLQILDENVTDEDLSLSSSRPSRRAPSRRSASSTPDLTSSTLTAHRRPSMPQRVGARPHHARKP